MLVEKLRDLTKELGWQFNYGQGHWQNLLDLPDDADKAFKDRGKHFLLLYQNRQFVFDDFGAIEQHRYEGEAIFCVRSRLQDEDYNYKYDTHIAGLKAEVFRLIDSFSSCDPWRISRWEEVEVENTYDTNLDGILIRFTLSYDGERTDLP